MRLVSLAILLVAATGILVTVMTLQQHLLVTTAMFNSLGTLLRDLQLSQSANYQSSLAPTRPFVGMDPSLIYQVAATHLTSTSGAVLGAMAHPPKT
jgi:hypothetical protein